MTHTPTPPIKVAIIGHTNTGKTSLLRTLLRDDSFGEVKNASATTRHVAKASIFTKDNLPLLDLYDTPGLEDATGVMDYLTSHTSERDDGLDRLKVFLEKVANGDSQVAGFSQEAKAISALLEADIAIYVIDARLPPTSKYKDELAILVYSAVPILPVFNFVKHTEHLEAWQTLLSRRALHVVNHFDTVAFDFDNEISLWQNLATLSTTSKRPLFDILINERQDAWVQLQEDGNAIIADFLVNVASFSCKLAEEDDPTPVIATMQTAVRQGEHTAMQRLLNLYKFYHSPLDEAPTPIQWQKTDLFDRHLLAHYGIRSVSAGTAGAVIGAGIDVVTLGTSLGLGTVVGGLLGGGLANASAIKDKLTGVQRLTIDDATLLVLANRLLNLHHSIRRTGHASLTGIHQDKHTYWQTLPAALKKARQKHHYSSLNGGAYDDNHALRLDLVDKLLIEAFVS